MVDSLLLGKRFSLLFDSLHWLLSIRDYLIIRIQIGALIQIVLLNYHIQVQFINNHAFLLRLFLISWGMRQKNAILFHKQFLSATEELKDRFKILLSKFLRKRAR